jgi:hypothetical protein
MLTQLARWRVAETERGPLARFMLGFAATIVAWAVVHDMVLIHVEPRHFTEYHRPLLPIPADCLGALAAQYAIVATVGPGLAFGALAWAACRAGLARGWGAPVPLARALGGFAVLMIGIELSFWLVGAWAAARWAAQAPPLYPSWTYPELSRGIVITQTINLSAYLGAPSAGALYLVACAWRRRARARTAVAC